FLTDAGEAVFALRKNANSKAKKATAAARESAVLKMNLRGANPSPQVSGQNETAAKSNYFRGNDADRWRANVPNFSRVAYREIY
ncbi:hypothetical protein C4K41_27980, partial [Escherichia coli]|uniref:DUF7948 domain-containing protein n=1 Tax=Escherichia coli TaxID=562 RepID=UPI000D4EE47C